MSYYSDDPAMDFLRHDREQEARLFRCPQCENRRCGKLIQDEFYFEIDGEVLCEGCMQDRYMRRTEDFGE